MAGWNTHKGKALALPIDNIDTDQLIPARFMSVPRSHGYGPYLLHDMRRGEDEALRPDFPLNRHTDASILVAGRNFGSGSSREAAVYALVDAGFRVVIAPSFGDIFSNNSINNGLLPARVSTENVDALTQALSDGTSAMTVDLNAGSISLGDLHFDFELDESWRIKLMNGWDDIDLTKQHTDTIENFRLNRIQTAHWAWPAPAD